MEGDGRHGWVLIEGGLSGGFVWWWLVGVSILGLGEG